LIISIPQLLARECRVWSSTRHTNIVPFYGICFDTGRSGIPSLVSPYYANGTLNKYCARNPGGELNLLKQIADALKYLHSLDIVHGDIKGDNILVNDSGQALLSDFSISRIIGISGYTTENCKGTWRWMPKELVQGLDKVNKPSDVYMFAMTVLEIISGFEPFHECKCDYDVMKKMEGDETPLRDVCPRVSDCLWSLLEECWLSAERRPSMELVLSRL